MTQPTPPAPKAAPKLRAFLVGLAVTVAAAVIPVVQASIGSQSWTAAGWQAVGYAALSAALTYVAHTVPPKA